MFWVFLQEISTEICRVLGRLRIDRATVGRGDAPRLEWCFEVMRTLLILFLLSSAALLSTLLAASA